MVAERLTAAAVTAEAVQFDDQDRAVVGQQVVRSAALDWALRDLAPREWEEIASYLFALIAREPVKSSPNYSGHRILLGYLANELRSFAASAGVPVGLEADLRAASTKAEEERIRARIFDQQLARERFLDDALLATVAQHQPGTHDEEQPIEEEPDAAPATETDDDAEGDLAYL